MTEQITYQTPQPLRLSMQMRAVLRILTSDPYLNEAAIPFLDLQNDSIDWERISKLNLGSAQKAAVEFARTLWTDQLSPSSQLFEEALDMGPELRQACVKALATRWSV